MDERSNIKIKSVILFDTLQYEKCFFLLRPSNYLSNFVQAYRTIRLGHFV